MPKSKDWFDYSAEVKRTFARSVWIPLKISENKREGEFCYPDYSQEFVGAHSILVPLDKRERGEKYSWSDDGEHWAYATEDWYKPAEVYQDRDGDDLGIRLVIRQSVPGTRDVIWHLNQDLVIALRLAREGDTWVRPEEGFLDVVRLFRNEEGDPARIEIRAEHLRDYLCARRSALRIATYRDKDAVLEEGDLSAFPSSGEKTSFAGGEFFRRAWQVDETGSPYGAGVGLFRVWRIDVDPSEDVPVMGQESDKNTESEQRSFTREGTKFVRAIVEFRRDEWIEPAEHSIRIRRDKVPSDVTFVVEADGSRMNADELDNEDIGRWLWFAPTVIPKLLSYRGNSLQWYTRETGGISTPSDPSIHFGINDLGLVTVYAEDVASLSEWERRLWAGHNVSPEGGVSKELLQAQVEAEVADTKAPEDYFGKVLAIVDEAFIQRFGAKLFRPHDKTEDIQAQIHRFRALNDAGVFELAKDATRVTADSLEIGSLKSALGVDKKDTRGSLKLLEALLSTIVHDEVAHRVMGPVFATYDLRLSDAHLPKSDILDAFKTLEIENNDRPILKGFKLIHSLVSAWNSIGLILAGRIPDHIRKRTPTESE